MIWSLLADAVVVVHFTFTTFIIFGGFLTWRWRWMALLHLPALAWGCWVELSSAICPLTPLEITCARSAVRPDTKADSWHTTWSRCSIGRIDLAHTVVPAGLLVAINALAYGRLLARRRSR